MHHLFRNTRLSSIGSLHFVGNGFYLPYLMAKSLFEGTPMFERIKFIAFSRGLSHLAYDSPESLQKYFDSLHIGEHKDRKIVIVDSVSADMRLKPSEHSLIRTANGIRKYLIQKGWTER